MPGFGRLRLTDLVSLISLPSNRGDVQTIRRGWVACDLPIDRGRSRSCEQFPLCFQ